MPSPLFIPTLTQTASQFTEDNVPELPYTGNVFPAYHSGRFSRGVSIIQMRHEVGAPPSKAWLSRCGADTMFFYKNLFLLPDKVAWLHFRIPDSNLSQVAFYLKQGDSYIRPELITIDYQPVYYAGANTTYPDALYVKPGIHQIQVRTRTDLYVLNNFQVCSGMKTVFFARVDSLGPYYWREKINRRTYVQRSWQDTTLARVIVHGGMPDTLTQSERATLLPKLLMYRNERYNNAWLFGGPQPMIAVNNTDLKDPYRGRYGYNQRYDARFAIVGPVNLSDSIGFYQEGNVKQRFLPEPDYIHSFRPGMVRVERQYLIEYLDKRFSGGATWPVIDTVNRQVMRYDTLRVAPLGPTTSYPEARLEITRLRNPVLFSFNNPWPDSISDARLNIINRERNTQPTGLLLRNSKGVVWSMKFAGNAALRVPAGFYTVHVLWKRDSFTSIPQFEVRKGGINVLPLWQTRPQAINYAVLPASWKPFVHLTPRDTMAWVGSYQHIPLAGVAHTGSIRGTVSRQRSGDDTWLILQLTKIGSPAVSRTVATDNNQFRFDSLVAGNYILQLSYAGGGSISMKLVVKGDTQTAFSLSQREEWRIVSNEQGQLFYTLQASGYAGIQGRVRDEAGEEMTAWPVMILQGGREVMKVYTDDEGVFLAKPLSPNYYEIRVIGRSGLTKSIQNIPVGYQETANVTLDFGSPGNGNNTLNSVVVVAQRSRPVLKQNSSVVLSADQIQNMPSYSRSLDFNSSGPMLERRSSGSLNSSGGRSDGQTYIVDGIVLAPEDTRFTNAPSGSRRKPELSADDQGENDGSGNEPTPQNKDAAARQTFINNFLNNAMAGSGLRKSFRDWAIWEPNLWTGDDGEASFNVTYPDNLTSWKTYVLAMNRDGYSGKIVELTRAYKPLSASLSAPRFLRYGDTAIVIGKVANYTGQAFSLRGGFQQNGAVLSNDTLTVNNSRVSTATIVAPSSDSIGTLNLPITYSIVAESGFTDGEDRTLPVYPVGTLQSSGEFLILNSDTTVSSRPDSSLRFFTGKAHLYIDGGLLDVMLREIQNLKEYPYGCMEQITTKLLAISYEEKIKRMLGDLRFNNTKTKRKILEALVAAQHRDGGFSWFRDGPVDYRITNYILSTMQKMNDDHWLDVVLRRGLGYLSNHLGEMSTADQITALSTLSEARYTTTYAPVLERLDTLKLGLYDRMTLLRIRKEQQLSYASRLDTLLLSASEDRTGLYWSFGSYDWYRDDLATNLMALRIVRGDSVYGHLAEKITRHILLQRQTNGYYRNTASSGLVLTTILPDLLKTGNDTALARRPRGNFVQLTGTVRDTFSSFPQRIDVKSAHPQFTIRKTGLSPVYASVVYDYYNPQPVQHDSNFRVRSFFLNPQRDTVLSLKQGEKTTVRAVVTVRRAGDYVMVNVPIPAGCVQNEKDKGSPAYYEAARESFKDQTAIFCNHLNPGVYTFDVVVEARYKGSYSVNPARAGLMYFPEEYGNTDVKRVMVR